MDNQGKPWLPKSCLYLFSAFYKLAEGGHHEVSIHDWVKFWFRGPSRYAEPPQRASKGRATKPRLNHNPSGHIDMNYLPRTDEEHAPFVELGVEDSLRDETNLSAFLTCWLCKFVLPHKKIDYVRASVLKVASLMAHGEKFSLAVPVLASIYRGLREISTSPDLRQGNIIFPIHYVYGWLGEYFKTHHRANHSHRSIPLCKISGEKMAKYFNFSDARKLFQQDDARHLHHLALLQGRELYFTDTGDLSDSWNDTIISLRSSYVTLRHDADLIVESYSPYRFSRQFGFCQDIPGDLMERPYDGTLLTLAQLWNSSIRLGTSSKVIIPVRPSEGSSPLMTREYMEWWLANRTNPSEMSPRIISQKSKQDHTPMLSKRGPTRMKEKPHPSSKSEVQLNDTPQALETSSKSKTLKDVEIPMDKGVKRIRLVSKTSATAPKVTNNTSKRREPSSSLDKGAKETSSLAPPCNKKSRPSSLPIDVGNTIAASSSTESNTSGDRHWNRLERKSKESDDHHNEFADLDTISIGSDIHLDGDPNSMMGLEEVAEQLGFQKLDAMNAAEVVVDQITHPKTFRPSSQPLQPSASSFDPQGTIFRFKSTFVSEIWGALCGWITQFSLGSLDSFMVLEASIASTLEELRKINIIDVSALEGLVENFFKAYAEYDSLKSSKMTKELHQESLSDAQRRLDDAKQEHGKLDGSMKELQANLANVEKDLAALNSKKEKIIAFLDKYQEELSKNQEKITITEGEIYTIEANHVLSDEEAERLSKLEEAVEKSRQQILCFKPFP
ncbi:uncharacterized protein LOC132041452 [Lycium ferocissimum]|uniref:uncharacterized protein LOC132041452 n=1 Tax=Lycium ferocissimum TaxID=112874 RepID=UPI002815A31F|nr:uncharacterized protein LOC132041452 [Lycium ferocissimum]